jgi:hypothetical protein
MSCSPTRLEALCDALRAAGAVVLCESRTSMRVRGHAIAPLAGEIRYFKPELLRGLFGRRGAEPYACARCGAEVVTSAGERCLWCAKSVPTELTIRPNSPAEVAYLGRVLHSEKSSQTSHVENWDELGNSQEIRPRSQDAAA